MKEERKVSRREGKKEGMMTVLKKGMEERKEKEGKRGTKWRGQNDGGIQEKKGEGIRVGERKWVGKKLMYMLKVVKENRGKISQLMKERRIQD